MYPNTDSKDQTNSDWLLWAKYFLSDLLTFGGLQHKQLQGAVIQSNQSEIRFQQLGRMRLLDGGYCILCCSNIPMMYSSEIVTARGRAWHPEG